MLADRIAEIQAALAEGGLDGWLFAAFQQNDPVSLDLLGLSGEGKLVTRRCYYLVPAKGAPRKLAHGLEPAMLDHLPGDRRFHLDGRLVRHHVGDLLIFFDRVADTHVPGDDLGLGNSLADVGQLEFEPSHYSAMTFSSARFIRFGPGK